MAMPIGAGWLMCNVIPTHTFHEDLPALQSPGPLPKTCFFHLVHLRPVRAPLRVPGSQSGTLRCPDRISDVGDFPVDPSGPRVRVVRGARRRSGICFWIGGLVPLRSAGTITKCG